MKNLSKPDPIIFDCPVCTATFNRRFNRDRHVELIHKQPRPDLPPLYPDKLNQVTTADESSTGEPETPIDQPETPTDKPSQKSASQSKPVERPLQKSVSQPVLKPIQKQVQAPVVKPKSIDQPLLKPSQKSVATQTQKPVEQKIKKKIDKGPLPVLESMVPPGFTLKPSELTEFRNYMKKKEARNYMKKKEALLKQRKRILPPAEEVPSK